MEFRDEADTINARAAELHRQGVNAIVVLIHEGGYTKGRLNEASCPGLTGDILPILDRLDPTIDVVASAHTHQPYVCRYKGFLLTSAMSYGRLVTDIDLELDRATGRVLRKAAINRIVVADPYGDVAAQPGYDPLAPDTAVDRRVGAYVAGVAPFANRAVGTARGALSAREDANGQSPLGGILADADLQATRGAGARIALLNPGSVRASIDPADGVVTYGALFRTQPFGNNLVTMTLTGAQILAVLEQQWLPTRQQAQILQVSQGLSYSYRSDRPMGSRVVASTLRLDGVPIVPTKDYRVTVNSFMASGGDGFTVLIDGRDKVAGIIDVDAAEAYFGARSPIGPPASRIRLLKD